MKSKFKFTLLLSFLSTSLLLGSFLYVNDNTKEVKADSSGATLLFGHGTPGTDLFYNYCPSIMQTSSGERHIYYCTNKTSGNVTDYIGYRSGTLQSDGSYSWSSNEYVLSPSSGEWDERHTCDPSVIKGDFKSGLIHYNYLMAYLGCVTNDNSKNEVGLAVSLTPDGPWHKLDSLNPFCHFIPSAGYDGWEWGYGQPSLVSIDKEGQVLLTYTTGERYGTYIVAEKWDLSDLKNPVQLQAKKRIFTTGLKQTNGSTDNCLNNADFAYDEASGRIYAIRDNHPNATLNPTVGTEAQLVYLEPNSSDTSVGGNLMANTGEWKILKNIGESLTGLERNHNCGLVRDEYGHLNNPKTISVIVTSGFENPSNDWWTALSTYCLYEVKCDVAVVEQDFTIDTGVNATFFYSENSSILSTWRLMPQSQNFSSGQAIAFRIKNHTKIKTPLRIAFNCTSNYRKRALSNNDESKLFHLLSVDGEMTSAPYRTWDGDVILPSLFNGWLIMDKNDQVTDTSYPNEGTFTWNSIFAIYFSTQNYKLYDAFSNYDIGDVYTANYDEENLYLVNPILQSGLVSDTNTNTTYVLDTNGSGNIYLNRLNISFLSVTGFINRLYNANMCVNPSSLYGQLKPYYDAFSNNNLLMSYFNEASFDDYALGDSSHAQNKTYHISASAKWNKIIELSGVSASNKVLAPINRSEILVVVVGVTTILMLIFCLYILKKKKA